MSDQPSSDQPSVLLVCVHNAGRSQLDDPAGQDIEAVRLIRDQIKTRIERLITELDVVVA